MSSLRIPSPARSERAAPTTHHQKPRRTGSVDSPALSNVGDRLSSMIQEYRERNMGSFVLSPLVRRSMLTDNTDIEEPTRKSWWKKLDENSRDATELLAGNNDAVANNIHEDIDLEILSQEKKDYTLDLPESSDSESINSIVIPQRRLFTEKENQVQKKFGQFGTRDTLNKLHKTNTAISDDIASTRPKQLFQNKPRSKPCSAALLNISPNKTTGDKTMTVVEPKGQTRNIFGNRQGTKRKNIYADFIVSESEDEIPDIQPKVFEFPKKADPIRRGVSSSRCIRDSSPTSSITTDMELDNWKLLPSSTMVENQIEAMMVNETPKKTQLSKLSEAKESDAGTNNTETAYKTKHTNKSISSENMTKNTAKEKLPDTNTSVSIRSKYNKVSEDKQMDKNESRLNKSQHTSPRNDYNISQTSVMTRSKNRSSVLDKNASINNSQNNSYKINTSIQTKKSNERSNIPIKENLTKNVSNPESVATNYDHDQTKNEVSNDNIANQQENRNSEETSKQNSQNETEADIEVDEIADMEQDKFLNASHEVVNENKNEEIVNQDAQHENYNENKSKESINQSQKMATEDDGDNNEVEEENQEQELSQEIQLDIKQNESQEVLDVSLEEQNESQEEQNESQEEQNESQEEQNISQEEQNESDEKQSENMEELNKSQNEENISQEDLNESQDALNETQDEQNEIGEEEAESEEEEKLNQNESHEDQNTNLEIQSENEQDENESEAESEIENDSYEVEIESEGEEQNISQEETDQNENEVSQEMECDEQDNISQDLTEQNETEISQEMECDQENESDEEAVESDQNESNSHQQHSEDEAPNVSHETTGRDRKKVESPEVIRHNTKDQADSFTVRGRNTSVRKTKNIENLDIRPSLEPVRESIGSFDASKNSSAEGSGWDSHRTTRKTLRQTFGKDFSPRKSLRALVMEKSAKRHTMGNDGNITGVTGKFPLANSTELAGRSAPHDDDEISSEPQEDHDLSGENTLEMCLQMVQKKNMERRLKVQEAVLNSLKAQSRGAVNPFKVPARPAFQRRFITKPAKANVRKPNKTFIPLEWLPEEVVADMKYKPPKRFQPSNAAWITKRLYKYIETKLEPKYDYKARVRAEKLVETLYHFAKDLRRRDTAGVESINNLKQEMARLKVVKTHFEFYEFVREFMPKEVKIKVVPDVVNNIPLPRNGVFSDIL